MLSVKAYLFIIITLEFSRYFEITNMTEYSSKENISRTVTYSSSNKIQKEDENYSEEMRFNQEGEESTKATIYIRNLGFPPLLIVITLLTVTAFIVLKKRLGSGMEMYPKKSRDNISLKGQIKDFFISALHGNRWS